MSKDKLLSAEEIKKHWGKGDLWIALHGKVYDVSDFMEDHPYVSHNFFCPGPDLNLLPQLFQQSHSRGSTSLTRYRTVVEQTLYSNRPASMLPARLRTWDIVVMLALF